MMTTSCPRQGEAFGDHGPGDSRADNQNVACEASGDRSNVRSAARIQGASNS